MDEPRTPSNGQQEGTRIATAQRYGRNPLKTPSSRELDRKTWSRFAKIVYLFSYIVAIGYVSHLAYEKRPIWEERKKAFLVCEKDGARYDLQEKTMSTQGLLEFTDTFDEHLFFYARVLYPYLVSNMHVNENAARRFCEYGLTEYRTDKWQPVPEHRNYDEHERLCIDTRYLLLAYTAAYGRFYDRLDVPHVRTVEELAPIRILDDKLCCKLFQVAPETTP